MEKRMLLAIVLSFLAVTMYSAITGRGCMAPPPKKPDPPPPTDGSGDGTANDTGTNTPAQPAVPDDGQPTAPVAPPADGAAPPPSPPAPKVDVENHPQRGAPVVRAMLESDELEVGFISQGGAIEFVRQKNAFESDGTTRFDQILPPDPIMLMGAIDDVGVIPTAAPGDANRRNMAPGPMRRADLPWTRDAAAEAATPERDVVFTFRTPAGLTYHKQWFLAEGEKRYDVRLRLWVTGAGEGVPQAVSVKLLVASGHLREHVQGAFAMPNGVVWRTSMQKDLSSPRIEGLETVGGAREGEQEARALGGLSRTRLEVFGARSPYFLTLYYNSNSKNPAQITDYWATGEDAADGRVPIQTHIERFYEGQRGKILADDPKAVARVKAGVLELHHCWVRLTLPVGAEPQRSELGFYVGPTERSTLRQDGYEPLRSVITYPNAFDFVADALLAVYDLWRGIFGSVGFAIILMTLCVRGAMMPLSIRNQLSMRRYGRKVSKLKPKVQALQQRFANNPKRLREEQMKLYREHGVGFPTGCLMMLIQIPIFFALFSSLRVEYTIRGAEFLWIHDLSGPDKLIDFGSRIFDIGILYVESLNILPLLMVTLSIFHMRGMPKPVDEQQAQQMRMMKWLPIVFAVILYNYTAALALYMVLSSAIAIVESKIVRAKDDGEGGGAILSPM
jgi:YidC/Oxa1 family membrane protein insertase